MGARNSTPQDVRIENPQPGLAMQITPSVVSRLVGSDEETKNKTECAKCREKAEEKPLPTLKTPQANVEDLTPRPNWTQAQDVFHKKYNELEEHQFDQSMEKVKTMIGKPLSWVEDVAKTVESLKRDIITCYQDHPNQSLECSEVTKKYQEFILGEQYKSIMKFNEGNGNNNLHCENECSCAENEANESRNEEDKFKGNEDIGTENKGTGERITAF